MKSINLIPARHSDNQLRTWLALALIVALAAGSLAGIYYYVDSIHTKSAKYLADAREVERQTAEFMAKAASRVSTDQFNDLTSRVQQAEAARIGWETYLLEMIRPLPQSTVLQSVSSEGRQSLLLRADFLTYDEVLAFIHRMEELPSFAVVSVNTFTESVSETTESVPVTDAEGNVLYHDTTPIKKTVYHVDLRITIAEGVAGDEQ